MLVFVEEGKIENAEKNKARANNRLNPHTMYTCMTPGCNRSLATLVGGKLPHHFIIPAPQDGATLLLNSCNIETVLQELSGKQITFLLLGYVMTEVCSSPSKASDNYKSKLVNILMLGGPCSV